MNNSVLNNFGDKDGETVYTSLDNDRVFEIINHWETLTYKPIVIAFDLNRTLWPFKIEKVTKPITKKQSTAFKKPIITDATGKEFEPFAHVNLILSTLKKKCLGDNQYLAIASTSAYHDRSMECIEAFEWLSLMSSIQIYRESKDKHMKAIKHELGISDLSEVLFFDDKMENYVTTTPLGVTTYLVKREHGLTVSAICEGLTEFDNNMKKRNE